MLNIYRSSIFSFGLVLLLCLCAAGARAATCTVNALTDTGAGSGGANGAGDLRYCITQTNASPGADIINVAVTGTVMLGSLMPPVNESLTINGSGQTAFIIDGTNITGTLSDLTQPFYIQNNGTIASFNNLTVRNGRAGYGGGGAIRIAGDGVLSTLNLTNVTLDGNTAAHDYGGGLTARNANVNIINSRIINNRTLGDQGNGGGIGFVSTSDVPRALFISGSTISGNMTTNGFQREGGGVFNNSGTVRIENTTISGNTANGGGGGIETMGFSPTLLSNVTISGNTAGRRGGGISSSSPVTLRNSTIAGNSAVLEGGGIYHAVGAFTIANVIVADNAAPTAPDVRSAGITRLGANIFKTPATGVPPAGSGTVTIADPLLNPLANNGGLTLTHSLQGGSPARDTGVLAEALDTNSAALTSDGRGAPYPRVVGANVDIGAVEFSRLVTNANSSGAGSLRQTIADAPAGETILFDPVFFSVPRTIPSGGGVLVFNKNLTINGPGANLLTLDGENAARIMNIDAGTLNLSNVRLTRGNSGAGISAGCILINGGTLNASAIVVDACTAGVQGGGIYNNGTLALTGSTVTGNTAAAFAAGIFNESGRTATITDSVVSNNTVSNGSAGGIGNNGIISLVRSTLSGNTARLGGGATNGNSFSLINSTVSGNRSTSDKGGGIYNNAGNTMFIVNSTITNNRSDSFAGAGIWNENFGAGSNTVKARNTIIAGNISGNGNPIDFAGNLTDLGNNLIGGNPQLAPLGNYGGATPTHALLPNSPALDAGNNCVTTLTCSADNPPFALATDGRGAGAPRRIGASVDIGAFERSVILNQTSLPNGSQTQSYSQTLTATRAAGFAELLTPEKIDFLNANPLFAPFTFSVVPIVGQQLPPGLTLAANGTLAGVPTTLGTFTFTVKAADADAMAGVQQFSLTIAAFNNPPTLSPANVSRQAGTAVSTSTIATVGDVENGASGVNVTLGSANPSNGVTISNIVNTNGTVTANVVAACSATNASFTLNASDGANTTNGALNVSVSANTAPSLAYPASQTVFPGSSINVSPTAASDNGTVTYSVLSVTPALVTAPTVNAGGVVSITGAQPAGSRVITIRATDNCGATTDSSFTLNVSFPTKTVTKTADTNDGVCDADCSLREAIAAADPGDSIEFSALFNTPQTIALGSTLNINKSLTINGTGASLLTIDGQNQPFVRGFFVSAPASVTVNINNLLVTRGSNSDSGGAGIKLEGGATLNLNSVTIDNNTAGSNGGGIGMIDSTLNIFNSRITNNRLLGNYQGGGIIAIGGQILIRNTTIAGNTGSIAGGGLRLETVSLARIENSTISGNTSSQGGGFLIGGAATVLMSNTTISGNVGGSAGGGIFNFGNPVVTLRNCTVAGNSATQFGGGIQNSESSVLNIANTIIADNSAVNGANLAQFATLNASGANIVESGVFGGTNTGAGTISSLDPKLNPLADNGGLTATQSFQATSPALNAGVNAASLDTSGAALAFDQRGTGFSRIANGTVDIGAFEFQGTVRIVTNDLDGVVAGCLRQVIAAAAAGDTIIFSPAYFNQPRTISLGTELLINKSLTIEGTGAGNLTLDANQSSRVFNVTLGSGNTVNVSNLTVTRGFSNSGGGFFLAGGGTLNLSGVTVSDNRANNNGGGIFASGSIVNIVNSRITGNNLNGFGATGAGVFASGSNFSMTGSTVAGNAALVFMPGFSSYGGGLYFQTGTTAQVENSTITNNRADIGGGVFNNATLLRMSNVTISGNPNSLAGSGLANNTTAVLRNSTIAANTAVSQGVNTARGGGIYNSGSLTLANTIVADNSAPTRADVDNLGTVTVLGINIVENGISGGATNGAGTVSSVDPLLAPLGSYGGATETHALNAGSPARDAGVNAEALNPNGAALTFDQRGSGAPRISGAVVDVGAFEQNITFNPLSVPNGTLGVAYNLQLTAARQAGLFEASENPAAENIAPAAFEIIPVDGQSLPPGLTLSPAGLLSGTPALVGSYTFTVKATDTDAMAGTQQFSMNIFGPTAAGVSVAGMVLTASGQAASRIIVSMTDSNGAVRSVQANSFGHYSFENVRAGETYVIQVVSARYQSTPQIVTVSDNIAGLNLTVNE